jgi:hypothetical protein
MSTIWGVTSCSPVKINKFGGTYSPKLHNGILSQETSKYAKRAKKMAVFYSETSVNYCTAWCHIPGDSIPLYNIKCNSMIIHNKAPVNTQV